jgi:ferredoxin, 2Fe-2S
VRVEPAGLEFDVGASETMMQAALRHGYRWPTVCGGEGQCRACFVEVLDGQDRLCPVGRLEAEGIRVLVASGEDPATVRLACQARVRGAVTVHKHGVRLRRNHQEAGE